MKSLLAFATVLLTLAIAAHAAEPAARVRDNMRNARYGEIVTVKGGPFMFTGNVYNTLGLNDCPEALWTKLDPAQLKRQYRALVVLLNGPRHFVMDTASLAKPGPVATFDGLQARLLATVQLSLFDLLRGQTKPYTETKVARTSTFTYFKGRPVYELISPEGTVYVMQTYSLMKDPNLTMAQLPGLGSRLKLPKGWKYQVRVPTENLALKASGTAYVLQDDLLNSYQRQ